MATETTTSRSNEVFVGMDPGQAGAIVALDARGTLRMAADWRFVQRARRRVVEMRIHRPGLPPRIMRPARLAMVAPHFCAAMEAAGLQPVSLACEDAYLGRNPRTVIVVARASGMLMGPMEALLKLDTRWVRAADWRNIVLGLPPATKREVAKSASLRLMPARCPGTGAVLAVAGELDHITDAAGVAEWSRVTNRNNKCQQEENRKQ